MISNHKECQPTERSATLFSQDDLLPCYGSSNHTPKLEFSEASTDMENASNCSKTEQIALGHWKVQDCQIDSLPPFYPLERTSRVIERREAAPNEIAIRISKALKRMSISAFYFDKGTARLYSQDHNEMDVHLFKHKTGGTVVEVQARSGCSVSFYAYARQILDAARGLNPISTGQYPEPTQSMLPMRGNKSTRDEWDAILVGLEVADKLLKDHRMDANRLGMDMLYVMTEPGKTSPLTAVTTCQIILFGSTCMCCTESAETGKVCKCHGNNEEQSFISRGAIHNAVFSHLGHKGKASAVCPKSIRSCERSHEGLMHNLALALLANSLEVICKDGPKIDNFQYLGGRELISSLIEILEGAASRPHDSYQSARCLTTLMGASEEAKARALDLNLLDALKKASDVGRQAHFHLEAATNGLFSSISNEFIQGSR